MRRFQPLSFAMLAVVVVFGACSSTPASSPATDQAAIRATDARWLAAARAHDLEQTLAYWSDDALVMPPGAPAMLGKQALRQYVAGAFATPDFSITWVTEHVWVAKSGDLAYTTGTDRISLTSPEGKPVVENNKAVAVWRKEPDGSWKCVVDIWNAAGS